MKKFALVGIAVAAFGSGVEAADLGVPRNPIADVFTAPAFSWSGFSVGGVVGGASNRLKTSDQQGWGAGRVQSFSSTKTSLLGGVSLGYNSQFSNVVLGVEGSLGYLAAGQRRRETFTASNTYVGVRGGLFGDLTARAGVAVDRALFYVKGGAAIYNGRRAFSTNAPFNTISGGRPFVGWTAGAGVEYAHTSNWTSRVEYQYYDFGHSTFTVNNGRLFNFRQSVTSHTLKVGANYLFSTGS